MSLAVIPQSLRFSMGTGGSRVDGATTLAACAMAAGSIGTAEAQQASALPPVTVDAPIARPRAAPPKPSKAQIKARTALRQKVRERAAPAPLPATASPSTAAAGALPLLARADANPYADPAAPYKADRLSSNKFTEPLLNTPRTVTVLTKEVLDDQERHQPASDRAHDRRRHFGHAARAATLSAIASSSAASTRATTSSSTASAIPASASAKTSSPSRSRSCGDRLRPSPGEAPRAAPSTSSPRRLGMSTSRESRRRSAAIRRSA